MPSRTSRAAAITLSLIFAGSGIARADASCISLLNGKITYLNQHHGYFTMEMTVDKDSLSYDTYSSGWLELSGTSWLYGTSNLLFSDRFSGNQPFNVNASESLQIWIDSTGRLYLYNNNYSYYVVYGADMSCNGGLLSKYVPGLGQVTLVFRSWFPPIY